MQRFASQGYDIIACSISESKEFLALCNEIESDNNIHITHIVYDSTCDQSFLEALSKVESYEDEISILVNNTGINIIKQLFYTELEDLRSTFAVNSFSDEIIEELLRLKWWNIPESILRKYIDYFRKEVTLQSILEFKDNLHNEIL